MRFSISYFTLILVIFSFTTAFAQVTLSEGYYVGFKKDTVRGFFNLDNLPAGSVLFYVNKRTSNSRKLTPNDVQQIELRDKPSIRTFFYTYKDQKESLFITKYADGNVSLYKGNSFNPDEPDVYFISSIKMPLIRKISKTHPQTFLNTYFKGCELPNNFTVQYTENSLLAAVNEISKCAFPQVEAVQDAGKIFKIQVEMGLKTALFFNQSKVKGWLNDQPLKTNTSPLVGVILGFKASNSFTVYTGVNYFRRALITTDSVRGSYFTSFTGRVYYTEPPLVFTTNFLEIPIALHYEFVKRKPTYIPKIIVGASLLTPKNPKYQEYNRKTRQYADSSATLYESSRINPSFFIGGGVKKVFKNKSILDLNLKYAFETDDPTDKGRIFSNRFELSLNYLFPIFKK
jgi:Outer membrane protein beta-barrel domain